ncbi:hypothetical protein ACQP2T_63375 (plasmid) [Nonomuraea sp. CA-143628]|uniref:hypothetical protein n=1 Tax=Nonomuraea sp. CA-143628 TaxID=3239997 RepID=UPI003D8BFE92
MDVVIATDTVNITWQGKRMHIPRGTAWDASDPMVKANPGLFSADNRFVNRTVDRVESAADEPPVERATRAPGERSQTRRPRAQK